MNQVISTDIDKETTAKSEHVTTENNDLTIVKDLMNDDLKEKTFLETETEK